MFFSWRFLARSLLLVSAFAKPGARVLHDSFQSGIKVVPPPRDSVTRLCGYLMRQATDELPTSIGHKDVRKSVLSSSVRTQAGVSDVSSKGPYNALPTLASPSPANAPALHSHTHTSSTVRIALGNARRDHVFASCALWAARRSPDKRGNGEDVCPNQVAAGPLSYTRGS